MNCLSRLFLAFSLVVSLTAFGLAPVVAKTYVPPPPGGECRTGEGVKFSHADSRDGTSICIYGSYDSNGQTSLVQEQVEQNTDAVLQNAEAKMWPGFGSYIETYDPHYFEPEPSWYSGFKQIIFNFPYCESFCIFAAAVSLPSLLGGRLISLCDQLHPSWTPSLTRILLLPRFTWLCISFWSRNSYMVRRSLLPPFRLLEKYFAVYRLTLTWLFLGIWIQCNFLLLYLVQAYCQLSVESLLLFFLASFIIGNSAIFAWKRLKSARFPV